jgi:hypothetical protein
MVAVKLPDPPELYVNIAVLHLPITCP